MKAITSYEKIFAFDPNNASINLFFFFFFFFFGLAKYQGFWLKMSDLMTASSSSAGNGSTLNFDNLFFSSLNEQSSYFKYG